MLAGVDGHPSSFHAVAAILGSTESDAAYSGSRVAFQFSARLTKDLLSTVGYEAQGPRNGIPKSASESKNGCFSKSFRCSSLLSHSEPTIFAAFAMKASQPLFLRGISAIHSDTMIRL